MSKRWMVAGEWVKEPRIRETERGAEPLGGREGGGLAMFCTSVNRIGIRDQ